MRGATIVFDLDGTMVDTSDDLLNALAHAGGAMGWPALDMLPLRPLAGHGAEAMLRAAAAQHGHEPGVAEMSAAITALLAHYRANIARISRPYPGFEEAVIGLKRAGATLAVCTNKREELARALLSELRLKNYFRAIVGGDSLPVKKPRPEPLLAAIARAGGSPVRSAMVGDSEADALAARRAGVPFVLVDFGYAHAPPSLASSAVVRDYRELGTALAAALENAPGGA